MKQIKIAAETTMTLEQAFALAVDDNCTAEQWNQAERVLYKAGYCPICACDGQRSKLGKLEPATHACAGMADPVAEIAELKKYAVYP